MDKDIICVNKPIGWTSNDVVQFLKRKYHYKKVGHAGTLDPNASGVLVIGINEGTKKLSKLILDDKTYISTIQLGIQTDTDDIVGKVIDKQEVPNINLDQINKAIQSFINEEYYQYPPKYSAIKVHGKKLYEYARNNIEVDIKPRLVKINLIANVKYDKLNKTIDIELNVSKGFYIRSFARDLAKRLNTIGCVKSLVRTKSGEFRLSDCIQIDKAN